MHLVLLTDLSTISDYVYGVLEGTSVSLSQACDRTKPYEASTLVTLIKDGNLFLYDFSCIIHECVDSNILSFTVAEFNIEKWIHSTCITFDALYCKISSI